MLINKTFDSVLDVENRNLYQLQCHLIIGVPADAYADLMRMANYVVPVFTA